MKKLKIFLVCFCLLFSALVVFIYFAGIDLIIENKSGHEIRSIEVEYGNNRDKLFIEKLQDNQTLSKFLGKIGEGSRFDITWIDNSAVHHSEYGIYFYGGTGYETVRINFISDGNTELVYDGEQKAAIGK